MTGINVTPPVPSYYHTFTLPTRLAEGGQQLQSGLRL